MSNLFELAGEDMDVGYLNLRAGLAQIEREIRDTLQGMWNRYEPYADRDFRHAFAREPDARFWEMFLGCALLEAGKTLLPTRERVRTGGQPDICVVEERHHIWIEAITPDKGDSAQDGIPEIIPLNEGGTVVPQPKREIHLRITSALWTKSQAIARYRQQGVIKEHDVSLVAVGAGRFGAHAASVDLPLALSAVFPIGDEYITVDRNMLEVVDRGFRISTAIPRASGDIPRTAFLDQRFNHVSGLIWSRVSIGNMNRDVRKLSLIHNPLAAHAMPRSWGVWDREYIAEDEGEAWNVREIPT